MRIVFVNLHTDWMLLKTSSVYVYKYSAAIKHGYLLNYLLKHPEYEICSFLNDRSFSLFDKGTDKVQKFFNLFSKLENDIILKKNGIDPKRVTILRSPSDIRRDDIVIMYNIMSNNFRQIKDVEALKALSMVHFHGIPGEDDRMKESGIDVLFNESNLQKSSAIFQRYYNVDLPWIEIPFVFAERFNSKIPFSKRKNKAFSVGTITYKPHKEFIETYGNPCVQPIRKMIKDNQTFYANMIDCFSEDYIERGDAIEINANDLAIIKLYKKIHNRFTVGRQKNYFSFDMVEKFNEYKMHIVGEEVLGIPGIGFVEGMACGSAYIGLDSPMYRDWGLIPGVHYISYDGTKEGLKNTIEFWQRPENQDKLEEIANAGCNFVRENFRGDKIAEKLINKLKIFSNKKLGLEND